MTENIPNLNKGINLQNHEAEKTPDKINPKKSLTRYIIVRS